MKICFATNNQHKLEELQNAIGDTIELVSLKQLNFDEEIPETGNTLKANSLQKAQYIWDRFQIPTIADDTGLEVDALGGRPGVYSARYAGENCSFDDNMDKLLLELKDKENRNGAFKTVITFLNTQEMYQFEGVCEGEIIKQKSGNEGFGYDPIFKPKGFNVTFAEMSITDKNEISHRGKAVKKLVEYLKGK